MSAPKFPGFKNNTADFQGKRDQRASPLSYFDVDLSIARSPALGNLLNLNVGGNLFYVDQNPIIGGYGTVYFGDGSVRGGTPVYVGSGFLSNADFVQLSFENVAQPGKILRVIYGTDVNFKPQFGSIAQVNIANINSLPVVITNETIQVAGTVNAQLIDLVREPIFFASGVLPVNTPNTFLSARLGVMRASVNIKAILSPSSVYSVSICDVTTGGPFALQQKTSDPSGAIDIEVIVTNFIASTGLRFRFDGISAAVSATFQVAYRNI